MQAGGNISHAHTRGHSYNPKSNHICLQIAIHVCARNVRQTPGGVRHLSSLHMQAPVFCSISSEQM